MKFKSVIAIGLLTLSSAHAFANASLTLSISNFQVTSNGVIKPLKLFRSFDLSTENQIGLSGGLPIWNQSDNKFGFYVNNTESLTSANGAHAGITWSPNHLEVSTSAPGTLASAYQEIGIWYGVSAHTTITMSWDFVLSGGYSGPTSGTFSVDSSVWLGDQSLSQPWSRGFNSEAYSTTMFATSPERRSISFTNDSDDFTVIAYSSRTVVSVAEFAPAVPEPEMIGLGLAGLAVIGLTRIRRRR